MSGDRVGLKGCVPFREIHFERVRGGSVELLAHLKPCCTNNILNAPLREKKIICTQGSEEHCSGAAKHYSQSLLII